MARNIDELKDRICQNNAKALARYSNEELEARIREWEKDDGRWRIPDRNFSTFDEYLTWAASNPITIYDDDCGVITSLWDTDFTGTRAMKTELSRRLSREEIHTELSYDSSPWQ